MGSHLLLSFKSGEMMGARVCDSETVIALRGWLM